MKLKSIAYRGGGLSVFIKDDLYFIKRQDLAVTNDMIVWFIETMNNTSDQNNIIIGLVYRSPSYNNEREFIAKLEPILNKIQHEKKKVINYNPGGFQYGFTKGW